MKALRVALPAPRREIEAPTLFLVPPPPPLKWAGGKRWQVSEIRPLWESNAHRRLVEPFCGGLAIALGLNPAKALLADANPHLINFYEHLKNGLYPRTGRMKNEEGHYYAARAEFNGLVLSPTSNPRRRSELFYYLNRTGFNGLCRFNSKGLFNVPFGRYSNITYDRDFSRFAETFKDWCFRNESFEDLKIEADDFIYADPPYDVPFTTYSAGGFDWQQQVLLAEILSNHPGPVVLSNQATARIVHLYEQLGYDLKFLDAPRRISCTGDRRPAKEVLATRNL
jgi:DNA adenine methylase